MEDYYDEALAPTRQVEGCHCEEEPQALTWQTSTFLQRLLNNLCTEFVSAWKIASSDIRPPRNDSTLSRGIATSPTAPRNDNAVSFFDSAEMPDQVGHDSLGIRLRCPIKSGITVFWFFWNKPLVAWNHHVRASSSSS
ncbi:MAG: hypothetical protein IKO06_05600 [Alphaproteobacteria bacterium]|nr:hypothetical protein [Alphaproteobacteria bacterium]